MNYNDNKDTWKCREAVFLDWFQLSKLLQIRIFELIGRDISPHALNDGPYWLVKTENILPAEMQILLDTANADSDDRKNHSPDYKGHISMLVDYFAIKLLSPEMPFPTVKTVTTEDGVYFLSEATSYIKDYTGRENPPLQD